MFLNVPFLYSEDPKQSFLMKSTSAALMQPYPDMVLTFKLPDEASRLSVELENDLSITVQEISDLF